MTPRLKLMLAALGVIAALLVLDRPADVEVVEVSERAARTAPKQAETDPIAAPALAPSLATDAPIPDLFAGAEAPVQQEQAQAAESKPAERPARPFTLLGFRQEGQVREAYLLRGGDVTTVRTGDLLDKRYRVVALGGDSVDIKDNASGTAFRIGFEDHQ